MRWLLLACLIASPSYAAITFRGSTATPADNTAGATDVAKTITPVVGMVAGDLIELCAYINGATGTVDDFVITAEGGQAWGAFSKHIAIGLDVDRGSFKCFAATFNGTWVGSLTVSHNDVPNFNFAFSLVMKVAIPSSPTNVWAVDVTEAAVSYAAPGGSCDVSQTGQTSIGASSITFVDWLSLDDNSWTLQTGGWTTTGSYRNTYGSDDMSIAGAYKVQSSPGATGTVVNRQTANGCDAGWTRIATWSETSSAPGVCSSIPSGKQALCPSGYTSIASGSVIDTLNASISPDIAVGDIPICDLVTSPSGYALTIGADGNFSYAASNDPSKQTWNCTFYDLSATATHASDLDAANNNSNPFARGEEHSVRYYLAEDVPMTPVTLEDLCDDQDVGETISYTSVDPLPTGLTIVDGVLSGTPTTAGSTVVTFRCTDDAGASTDFD